MTKRCLRVAVSAALAAAAMAAPAAAQKSRNTLRHLQDLPIATVDNYFDARPEVKFLTEAAFDDLIKYDFRKREFSPLLAKSWKAVNDTTYEFVLRDDVMWSDGEKFDADDVVYTFGWIIDPKTKLRFKANWEFIAKVEKTGPFTVRLITKQPNPSVLARLSTESYIVPEHVHGRIENKETFGAAPVGTGPYRIIQVDKNRGVVGELKSAYPMASDVKRQPTIGRLEIRAVGDIGPQIAELLAGNVDLVRDVPVDQAEDLAKRPDLAVTGVEPFSITYLMLDMKGRTGVKALLDVRVRRAISHAIDVPLLNKLVGGSILDLKRPPALCAMEQQGCGYSLPQPSYDPALARELLSKAGYGDGFDLEIVARPGVGQTVAEAITSQLRAVGIRASVKILSFAAYRKYQSDGKQQALISGWGGGNIPDVSATLDFLFAAGSRDYHGNQKWIDLADTAAGEVDDAKRRKIVQQLVDEVTDQAYVIMTTPSPSIWVHTKDVVVDPYNQPFFGYGLTMGEIAWKK